MDRPAPSSAPASSELTIMNSALRIYMGSSNCSFASSPSVTNGRPPHAFFVPETCLARLADSMPGLHVAGKTALARRGVRHNLAIKERLILWGDKASTLPTWFTLAFPADYQATHLFDPGLDAQVGVAPLPGGRPDVPVSTPERALLELLSDVGKGQELEEARHLVESARTLRPAVLDELLSHLKRIQGGPDWPTPWPRNWSCPGLTWPASTVSAWAAGAAGYRPPSPANGST